MSRRSIYLSIPKPCHEGWENMDANERGAFCHSCWKEVIDFSAMTDREVIEYLEKHKAGCGRFRKDQVDTKLTIPKLDNGIFRWRALFIGLLPILAFKPAKAFSNNHFKIEDSSFVSSDQKDTSAQLLTDSIQIKGKVIDEMGVGLIYANIFFVDQSGKSTNKGTMTDIDGYFSLSTSAGELAGTGHKIKVGYIGYESQTISVTNDREQNYVIKLKESVRMLQGDVIIVHEKLSPAQKIKYWFRRTFRIKHKN